MGRDAEGGSVARRLRRAIGRDPTEGRGTPIFFVVIDSDRPMRLVVWRITRRGGFILFQHLIRTPE
jgi:hypothetical protein